MKNIFLLILALLAISGCSRQTQNDSASKRTTFLKTDITQLLSCGADNPCQQGYSCTVFDNSGKAYCHESGKESEVIGCTSGQLVIKESYPAQVGCN